ncbi:MAG: hypothetical protein RLZZ500_1982 [Bacteroidota bacterium]|jgi:competence ComEA-like helix-hairpin-helix protein
MNINFIRQFTHFTKNQRQGILTLLLLLISLQIVLLSPILERQDEPVPEAIQHWLMAENDGDTLVQKSKKYTFYPFNPNFLTAYKAYRWGMTGKEFERLTAFREQNKYVNSAQEFQKVTQVSEDLLKRMAPYFKFPEWVSKAKNKLDSKPEKFSKAKEVIIPKDINQATFDDLIAVRGVGEVLADRIIKYRSSLGAFVSMEQLTEVYGLKSDVVEELMRHFTLLKTPNLVKIKINEATIKELGQFPYFRYPVSRNIVAYRSMNGDLTIEELTNVKGINLEKLKIIALYLEF